MRILSLFSRRRQPDRVGSDALARARVLYREEANEDARDAFQHALAQGADPYTCWRHLARLAARQQDWDAAIEAWQRVGTLSDSDAQPFVQMGRLFERRKDLVGAVSAYQEALRRDPDSCDPHAKFERWGKKAFSASKRRKPVVSEEAHNVPDVLAKTIAEAAHDHDIFKTVASVLSVESPEIRRKTLTRLAGHFCQLHLYDSEIACLEIASELDERFGTKSKLCRARFRAGNYERVERMLADDPQLLDCRRDNLFFPFVGEVEAATKFSTVLAHSPHRTCGTEGFERVGYCLHNCLPFASGGYATRTHGLLTALSHAGQKTVGLARPGFPHDIMEGEAPLEQSFRRTIDGIEYVFEPGLSRKGKLFRYFEEAGSIFCEKFKREGVDLVHAASNFYTGSAALYGARQAGLPFVYEVRGVWELTRETRDKGFLRSAIGRRNLNFEKICCDQADRIITLTQSMKDWIAEWGIEPDKIEIVPNSVDANLFTPQSRDTALATELGITESEPVVGYVGSFVDYEGLELLAQACVDLIQAGSNLKFLAVGDENPGSRGNRPITDRIAKLFDDAGYANRLILPGRIPFEDVPRYYSVMDVCPFPRLPVPVCEMVSPMKPLEALAMEKCVIVSDVGGMQSMVVPDETGLVFSKGDVQSLQAKLSEALNSPEMRRKLGEAGRQWVKEHRSWSTAADKLGQIYLEVSRARKRGGAKSRTRITALPFSQSRA